MGAYGNEHRAIAVKVVVEEIDRHRGEYNTGEERRAALERLISEHDLKDEPKALRGAVVPLTVKRFEYILTTTVYRKPRNPSVKQTIHDIWRKGSTVFQEDFLRALDVQQPSVTQSDAGGGNIPTETRVSARVSARANTMPPMPISRSYNAPLKAPTPSPITPIVIRDDDDDRSSEYQPSDGEGIEAPVAKKQRLSPEKLTTVKPKNATRQESTPDKVAHTNEAAAADVMTLRKEQTEHSEKTDRVVVAEAKHALVNIPVPKAVTLLAGTLVKISGDDISKEMTAIWTLIQSTTRSILEDNGGAGKPAAWAGQPHDELQRFYERLFGPGDWKMRLLDVTTAVGIKRKDALEACLAVAIFNFVFDAQIPWLGPDEEVSGLESDVLLIDRVLQNSGTNLTIETVLWQAAALKVMNAEFRSKVLQPAADDIARNIMLVLMRQLRDLGLTGQGQKREGFWRQRTGEVTRIVLKALILRGRLRAAPDYYEFKWVRSGIELKRGRMEEVNESEGKQEVTWCVSPYVRVKATKEGEWESASHAKVFTRPWPKKSK